LKTGELIQANCQITVLELSQEVGISVGSVQEILYNKLVVSKVSTRWVPRLLTTEHRERCSVAITQLLKQYEREGAEFLDSTAISSDTWVHYFTPESKTASKQWKHTESPPPKKSENFFSGDDHCYCVLGFKRCPSPGLSCWLKTINTQYYSALLNEKVKPAIRSKQRKRQDSVCFLQDKACPHTVALTSATLPRLKWDVLPHPAYSPDLAPSNYYLFGPMKGLLGGKRFQNNGEVIAGVQHWIQAPPKTFSEIGIKKLPESWHKFIAVNRDYTENSM
jgi:hypothetical protein